MKQEIKTKNSVEFSNATIELAQDRDELSSFSFLGNEAVQSIGGSTTESLSTKKELSKLKEARERIGSFINADPVQYFTLGLILINAIMMGIATFDFVSKDDKIQNIFETIDEVFLIIFTIEAGLQVFYEGHNAIRNSWLVFDIIVVVLSWSLSGIQVIRAVRVFRALRLVTRLKGMRRLIEALAKTLPRMAGITALLSLIIYIFSVMFTEFFREDYENGGLEYPYFARLDGSLLTSFQIMTFDNWAEIVREVVAVKSWGWIPLVIFVLITGFMVVHLVIAVICDAIADLDDEDKDGLNNYSLFKEFYPENDMDGDEGLDSDGDSDNNNDNKIYGHLSQQEQIIQLENQVQDLIIANERTMYWLEQITDKVDSMNNFTLG